MTDRPPLVPLRQELPFLDQAFTWQTFEAFFCDFLNAGPRIMLSEGGAEMRGHVIRARPFRRPGDVQEGIDLLADMEGGETWDFQCKRVKKWGPDETRKAIAAYRRDAARRFLLITCDVSEACHRVIAEHPGWALWDGREITRRFRELEPFRGAPILFTHFGPGWPEAFFGIAGNLPLLGAEAKYRELLREGRRFHHRHALIGHERLLAELDDFARDERARVFILIGRGGLGKSRLLLEWSRRCAQQQPEQTLRFVWDKTTDYGPSLQVASKPLIIVFDDAHRLDDVRAALIPELPHRPGIKLVLAMRPGPTGQVMHELLDAGFDSTEIITAEPMKRLDGEQAMALVTAALHPRFHHLRGYLLAASRDCPLVAVIGAELLNSGALVESDLRDAEEVRNRVFESMLEDAKGVRESFGAEATDDFLRLLALLGPVKLDAAFFAKAAPFLHLASADRATRLRDALDDAGLLLTTGAGTRVTPDLLSDHLAFDACYDAAGQSRTFAECLLESFSWEEFPKLMQHLAEAEWRVIGDNAGAASVVGPLWLRFRERFERSTFHERHDQLHQWMNIAHMQPVRTLQLAELALTLTTAPEPPAELEWLKDDRWNSHAYSMEGLPKMLGPVAENHAEYLGRCFDILWPLAQTAGGSVDNNQSHPLSVMNDVIRFKLWKRMDVYNAVLDWIGRLLAGEDWLNGNIAPGVLFERLFHPLFATSIENTWSSSRTFHFESHPLNLERSAPIRERVRGLLRSILARRHPHVASQLIPTLEHATDIARIGFSGSPTTEFIEDWDAERRKALAIVEELLRDISEPLLHFQVRRALMRDLRYGKDSPGYRDACREIVRGIPDTLDLRIARAAFSSSYDEFERDREVRDWQKVAEGKWATFGRRVARELHRAFPNGAWFDHLAELDKRWRAFPSFHPNFRQLLCHLAEKHPGEALAICEHLLAAPTHPLADTFDAIGMSAAGKDSAGRLRLIRAASESVHEVLRAAAVACCAWWRRDAHLPDEAWQILERLAQNASELVAERITTFVWWNDRQPTLRDWQLITSLPFAPQQTRLAGSIAARAADLIASGKVQPPPESIAPFIDRFSSLESVGGHDLERALQKLAEAFPVAVFLMLWRRNAARKAGNNAIQPLPYDFHRIPFRQIMHDPEMAAIIAGFEHRAMNGEPLNFDELRLLRRALEHSPDKAAEWFSGALERATTKDQLDVIRQLGTSGDVSHGAIAPPGFACALLQRARAIGGECHETTFRRLLNVGGGRGTTNDQPDPEWRSLLEEIERLAHQHAADSELGPLYKAMAEHERSWMNSMRSRNDDADEE